MKFEYIILNLLIILGPLCLSFDKIVFFRQYWRAVFYSIFISFIIFISWDSLAAEAHWFFNPDHTIAIPGFSLPVGEILFFITVPYACLFVWQVLLTRVSSAMRKISGIIYLSAIPFIFLGIFFLLTGKTYTAAVCLAIFTITCLDFWLKTHIFHYQMFPLFAGILIVMTLIFNGYLTARPIVLYNEAVQLNFRIGTIPVEDFFFGFAHIFLNVILYTHFKKGR